MMAVLLGSPTRLCARRGRDGRGAGGAAPPAGRWRSAWWCAIPAPAGGVTPRERAPTEAGRPSRPAAIPHAGAWVVALGQHEGSQQGPASVAGPWPSLDRPARSVILHLIFRNWPGPRRKRVAMQAGGRPPGSGRVNRPPRPSFALLYLLHGRMPLVHTLVRASTQCAPESSTTVRVAG
jgi:hypothetical protein